MRLSQLATLLHGKAHTHNAHATRRCNMGSAGAHMAFSASRAHQISHFRSSKTAHNDPSVALASTARVCLSLYMCDALTPGARSPSVCPRPRQARRAKAHTTAFPRHPQPFLHDPQPLMSSTRTANAPISEDIQQAPTSKQACVPVKQARVNQKTLEDVLLRVVAWVQAPAYAPGGVARNTADSPVLPPYSTQPATSLPIKVRRGKSSAF